MARNIPRGLGGSIPLPWPPGICSVAFQVPDLCRRLPIGDEPWMLSPLASSVQVQSCAAW